MKNIELKYLAQVLMLIPGNVYWKDKDGCYLGCNAKQLQVARVKSLEEIIGKSDKDLYSEEIANRIIKNDREVIEKRLEKTLEEIGVDSNGLETVYLTKKSPLYDECGQIIGLVGIGVDITEKKKAEQEIILAKEAAEIASRAKTAFLENMRHDIRTPVSGIVGCAQIIQSQADNPEKVSEYAKDLVRSSEALLEFLNKVLEGIKVATGEIPLLKKKFDIRKQLQAIIDLNKSLAAKKNLELSFNDDERIPLYLIGDPIRLQRIVLELVTNALNFTQQGKVNLSIKLKKQEAQRVVVEVSVTDTGVGIVKDKQEAIFVRFTRLTPSCQGIYKGLGLGLSIVKQFVDDLGGEIYVESQLNHGTVFTCLVPFQEPLLMDSSGVEDIPLVLESKAYPKTSKLRANRSTRNNDELGFQQRKILLVEDDPLAAKIAVSILSRLNGVIDIAPDANSALQRLQEQDYHLILMDIGLPDMDGISLTHRIRLQQWQCRDTTPIIGLTAHIDVENRQRCLDAGMNTVILKPLKKETALELLTTFVPDAYIHQEPLHFDTRPLTGPVFDIESMQELLKENDLIKDCVNLMLTGLERDLAKLPRLHQVSDWKSIRELAHKLRGGSGYCGAKRLEQACQQIIDYLRENDSGERANVLYHQLTQEMMAAKAVYEDYVEL
jgi:signal transduction histidine kinase/DNA-binding response OmpR family regulator